MRARSLVTIFIAGLATPSVAVTIEADSLQVREGTGGLKLLTDADR